MEAHLLGRTCVSVTLNDNRLGLVCRITKRFLNVSTIQAIFARRHRHLVAFFIYAEKRQRERKNIKFKSCDELIFFSLLCVFHLCSSSSLQSCGGKTSNWREKTGMKKNTHHPHMSPSTSTFLPLPNDTVAECTLIHHRHIRHTNQSSWSIRFADRSRLARSFRWKELLCQWKFDKNPKMCVRFLTFIEMLRAILTMFDYYYSNFPRSIRVK